MLTGWPAATVPVPTTAGSDDFELAVLWERLLAAMDSSGALTPLLVTSHFRCASADQAHRAWFGGGFF